MGNLMQATKMEEELNNAWAAGFIDGEGCIGIYPVSAKTNYHKTYRLYLKVTQVDPIALIKLQSIIGGSISPTYRNRTRPNGEKVREKYWNLYLASKGAYKAISQILPYLSLKRERAELAVKFQEAYVLGRKRPQLTPEEAALGQWFYHKMSELNAVLTAAECAAATTERVEESDDSLCNSLNCTDGKGAEVSRNVSPITKVN